MSEIVCKDVFDVSKMHKYQKLQQQQQQQRTKNKQQEVALQHPPTHFRLAKNL